MKAVLMAAGPNGVANGFPPNSKPKCLFHWKGEVILERQVRVLREAGLEDIIIVAGYKMDMIKKLNEDMNLGLNIVYNPSASSDTKGGNGWSEGLKTAQIGVESINDDVLLIMGDVLLTVEGIKIVVEDENKCISVYSGHGYQLYKIPKSLIPNLKKYSTVPGGMIALHKFCMKNGGIRMVIHHTPLTDLDSWMRECETKSVEAYPLLDFDDYTQSDEVKLKE